MEACPTGARAPKVPEGAAVKKTLKSKETASAGQKKMDMIYLKMGQINVTTGVLGVGGNDEEQGLDPPILSFFMKALGFSKSNLISTWGTYSKTSQQNAINPFRRLLAKNVRVLTGRHLLF